MPSLLLLTMFLPAFHHHRHNSRLFDRWFERIATAVLVFPTKHMKEVFRKGERAQQKQKQQPGAATTQEWGEPKKAGAMPVEGAFTFLPASIRGPRYEASTRLASAVMT